MLLLCWWMQVQGALLSCIISVGSIQYQSGVGLDLLDPLCNCRGPIAPLWPCMLDWADVATRIIKSWRWTSWTFTSQTQMLTCIRPVMQPWASVENSTWTFGAAICTSAVKASTSSQLSYTMLLGWYSLLPSFQHTTQTQLLEFQSQTCQKAVSRNLASLSACLP